jgi:multiple sugar transport system substrate-binding protein
VFTEIGKGVTMQHSRLRMLRVTTLVGLLVALAALTTAAQARVEGGAQQTTVTLAGWASSPEETAALNRTIASFERLNREIDVEYTPISGDYDAAMLARFAAKRPPDVFYVDSLDVFDYLPALEPLNSFVQRTRNFSTRPFFPRLLGGFTVDGRIYGFPKDWSPLGMIANTELLAKAGVSRPPQTWAQLTQALNRLRSTNAVPDGAPACLSLDWARILPFVYQNNGTWLNATKTRSRLNTPPSTTAVTTYLSWLQRGLARTPAQLGVDWCGAAMGQGKAGIVFEGNWIYSYLQKDFPNTKFAVYPMVRGKARGNLAFTVSYSIGKESDNKPAAWRLLRFLVGKQGQSVWSKNSGFLPSRSDVAAPSGRANFLREAPAARPWQFIKGFDRVYDFAGKELEKAFEGDQSIDVTLRRIDAETNRAIRRSR